MNGLVEFLTCVGLAAFGQNAVLTRGLESDCGRAVMKGPKHAIIKTALITLVTTVSAVAAWLLTLAPFPLGSRPLSEPLVLVVTIAALYGVMVPLLRLLPGDLAAESQTVLSGAVFSPAVLGTLLLIRGEQLGIWTALGYGIGSGIGFGLALVLVSSGLYRLRLCSVPQVFRGTPILLIYLGLLSMAFYGLLGHPII